MSQSWSVAGVAVGGDAQQERLAAFACGSQGAVDEFPVELAFDRLEVFPVEAMVGDGGERMVGDFEVAAMGLVFNGVALVHPVPGLRASPLKRWKVMKPMPGLRRTSEMTWGRTMTGLGRQSGWSPRVTEEAVMSGVPVNADFGGDGVGEHAFDVALAFGDFADFDAGFFCHALVGDGFEEFSDPDAAGIAGGTAGGEDVVGADGFVAVGDGGFFADEERAVVGEAVGVELLVFDVEFEMLGGVVVGELDGFFAIRRHRRCRPWPRIGWRCLWWGG